MDRLLDDIVNKDGKSMYFALFLIDVDNLKALNSSLGHQGADQVIKRIGDILKKHTKAVMNGEWSNNDKNSSLTRAWCFRFVCI